MVENTEKNLVSGEFMNAISTTSGISNEDASAPVVQASPSQMLSQILLHPRGALLGLVDDLLEVCREHTLRMEWQEEQDRLIFFIDDSQESTVVPFRKGIFRTIIARVATFCNEQTPDSVSPYGGEGELSKGANPATVLKVRLINTPAMQKLEVMPKKC